MIPHLPLIRPPSPSSPPQALNSLSPGNRQASTDLSTPAPKWQIDRYPCCVRVPTRKDLILAWLPHNSPLREIPCESQSGIITGYHTNIFSYQSLLRYHPWRSVHHRFFPNPRRSFPVSICSFESRDIKLLILKPQPFHR